MNKSFKVVFNKARGALMVVNEVTSSVQAKGTKTVIAAAVAAMVAGGAVASEIPEVPEGATEVTAEVTDWEAIQDQSNFVTQATGVSKFFTVRDNKVFVKDLWVTSNSKDTKAKGFAVAGTDVDFTNKGHIYLTSTVKETAWQNHAIFADEGAKATNDGVIVVKNAYGMAVGTTGPASTIINNNRIVVEDTGVGMELGGADDSKAVNNGTIVANTPVKGGFSHGVLIKDQNNAVFTNKGAINASAEGATAIEIQVSSNKKTSGAVINLEKGSSVDGLIHNHDKVEGTTLKANGFVGTIDLQNDSTNGMTIEVNQGADLTLADGHGSKALTAVVNDGMLSASIWQKYTVGEGEEAKADNQFTKVTVNEGGIFNVRKLNSTWAVDDPSTPDVDESKVPDGAAKDQLLIKGAAYELNGGKLYAEGSEWHGNVKVGTLGGAKSSLSLENGDYNYAKMTVGSDSKLTVTDSANVTLDSLHVYEKGTGGAGGAVTIDNGASVTVDDIKFEDATGKLTLNEGTLNTTVANLLDDDGALKGNFELTSGTIGIDGAFDISKATAFSGKNVTIVADEVVAMVDDQAVEITTIKNEDLSTNVKDVSAVGGVVYGTATLQATDTHKDDASAIHIDTTLAGVQKIEILNDKITHVDLDSAFQLIGDGSELVVGSNETSEFRIGAQTLTLGTTAEGAKGGTYAGTIKGTGKLAVDGGEFKLAAVDVGTMTVNDTSYVTVNTLKATTATVDGYLFASTIEAGSITSENLVGFQTLKAGATVKADGSDVYIAAAAKDPEGKDIAQVQGTVNLDGDSYLTTNTSAALDSRIDSLLAMDAVKYDEDKDAVAYIDQSILVGDKGAIFLGNVLDDGVSKPSVKLGSQSVTIINAANFMQSDAAVFGGAELTVGSDGTNSARIVLDNLLSKGSLKLAETINGSVSDQALISTNLFLDAAVDAENAAVAVTFNRDAVAGNGELADALDEVLAQGGNRDDQSVINAIGQYDAFLNEAGTALNDRGEHAAEEYLAMPVTAGTYNVAYDAAEQVTGTIQRRNLEPSTGLGVWADVFYSTNEAKEIYGGQGYSADIYGGTIGFDGTFSCGAKLGIALSVGSGDADSEKSVSDFSNDADFWGVSVYTGKDIAGLYFSADASYLAFDNDIKGSVAGVSADESIDSSVFTVGVRADMTVYDKAFKVVPHVGVRYTKIDVDDYRGLEADSMNVFETPVGVKVAGVFEPAAGWKLTPSFDFTIVPQLGDKEVNTLIGDVDVLDNVYNTTLGVNASYGNFTFGLSYRYGFGTDERSNNAFQARAAYAF